MMNFGEALEALKLGYKVKRRAWDTEYLVLITYGNQNKPKKAGVVQIDEDDWRIVYSYVAYCANELFIP